jgi:hypothetical protein
MPMVHDCEIYCTYEMHACGVHIHKMRACEMQAYKMHACEVYCAYMMHAYEVRAYKIA